MKSLISMAFSLLFVSSTIDAKEVQFSKNLASELSESLNYDIDSLNNYRIESTGNDLNKLLEIEQFDSTTLRNWLTKRINYVVEKDFDIEYRNMTSDALMTNIGAFYSLLGQEESYKYEFKIQTSDREFNIVTDSPEIGLIQTSDLIISSRFNIDHADLKSFINSLNRLAVLFHEARHSDSTSENPGFQHVECPINHDYEGRKVCDQEFNGPNNIAFNLVKALINNCEGKCRNSQKEMLKLRILDSQYRITSTSDENIEVISFKDIK